MKSFWTTFRLRRRRKQENGKTNYSFQKNTRSQEGQSLSSRFYARVTELVLRPSPESRQQRPKWNSESNEKKERKRERDRAC